MDVDGRQEAYAGSERILARRSFLKRLTAIAATMSWPIYLGAQEHPATLHVSDTVIGTMPEQFTGLSYESSQLSDPIFLLGG